MGFFYYDWRQMRAFLVEPSRFHQQIIGTLLKNTGFEVVMHASGETAYKALERDTEVALVCVSLLTSDISGIELCRQLRLIPRFKNLPIILITSKEDSRSTEEALNAGITDVYFKSDLQHLQTYLSELSLRLVQERRIEGKILYAEDSSTMAKVVIAWLQNLGLHVEHHVSGEPLLKAFEKGGYDLVLTDFLLQGKLSGLGIVREIRNTFKSRVPILVLSGFEDVNRRVEILRSGANDFVTKPVLEEELIARIRTLILNKQLLDELEAQQKRLMDMALTDQLTSLYHRHSLIEIAPKLQAEAIRHKYPLSLIMIDLDNFKHINDHYGHMAGDEVLVQMAAMLLENSREGDFASRFGGEEFLIILPHCDKADALSRAEKLRKLTMELKPNNLEITASFGVTAMDGNETTNFDSLIRRVDTALNQAKSSGKNRVSSVGS